MENIRSKARRLPSLVLACTVIAWSAAREAAADNGSSGWWPFGKPAAPAPADTQEDDPVSLKTKAKAGVELYVAVARLYVESGKYTEAEQEYEQALKKFPDDIRVLLGYAMLKDQMNQPQEAMKFYEQARKKHPKEPAVYNDLAIHYARWDKVPEAIEAARRAVELRPREARYRNNLAAMLVEAGLPREAFQQLREIYDEPVSHYNLGFLLNKRGMKTAALQEFTLALQSSPGMTAARQWVERLSRESAEQPVAMAGTVPALGPAPAAVNPPPFFRREEAPSQPVAPLPPQFAPPPQCMTPPQYTNPAPPLVAIPYPAQVQYPAQPQVPPQGTGPQPYQNPVPASLPVANPPPAVAAREPWATGANRNPSPPSDGNVLRRLPPVNDSGDPAGFSRDPQGVEMAAPIRPNGVADATGGRLSPRVVGRNKLAQFRQEPPLRAAGVPTLARIIHEL